MNEYTTTAPRRPRRARGNGFYALNCPDRYCETCGASLAGRRRQARFCCPTCRARAFDKRTGRQDHRGA